MYAIVLTYDMFIELLSRLDGRTTEMEDGGMFNNKTGGI